MNEQEQAQLSKDCQALLQSRLPKGSYALVYAQTPNPQEPVIFVTNMNHAQVIEQMEKLIVRLRERTGQKN